MDNKVILILIITLSVIVILDIVLFVRLIVKKKEIAIKKAREDDLRAHREKRAREAKEDERRHSFEEEKQALNWRIKYVAQNSESVKRVEKLNKHTGFKPVQKRIEYFHSCNSLKEY